MVEHLHFRLRSQGVPSAPSAMRHWHPFIGVISGKFLFIGVDQGISNAYIVSLICGKEGEGLNGFGSRLVMPPRHLLLHLLLRPKDDLSAPAARNIQRTFSRAQVYLSSEFMPLLSRNEMNNLKLNKVVGGCYHLGRPRVEMQWVLVERYSSSLHSPWTFLRVFPGISVDFPKGQPLHGCMTHAKHELHGEIPSQNISNYHLTDLPMAWVYKCEKKQTLQLLAKPKVL